MTNLLNTRDVSISFGAIVRLLEEQGCSTCQSAAAAIRFMIELNNTQTTDIRKVESMQQDYEKQLALLEDGILRFSDLVHKHVGAREYEEILNTSFRW